MFGIRVLQAINCGHSFKLVRSLIIPTTVKSVHVKHELHEIIKWNPPENLPMNDLQVTGDTRGLPKVDPRTLCIEFQPFAEKLDKLPDYQRKLFTIALAKRSARINFIHQEITSLTQRHVYDFESPEYKVAHFTVRIRSYQEWLIEVNTHLRGRRKALFKEAVDKRQKYLTRLKNQDIKKFEWILGILGVIYKPLPEVLEPITRKGSIRKLTHIYCESLKAKKLYEYKLELEEQKIPFLEEKLAVLQQIQEEEETMRLPSSVEHEIYDTEKRLEKLKKSHVVIKPIEPLELVPTFHVPDILNRASECPSYVRR